ncbi:MAG: pseudaminic acid cytidylyltransferase [Bacteroidetes bacterium GWF2_42_66]|nr:MAG: pseudaminic acid cytidylyltransferase [Bacteroidetes bacterium GWA2_42_15]OFX96329.1 MAG: pseudaminic acid cytidylyltransferase [Bacteroidetes bacterium GWE2_42_39]OFY46368.1 MAG: pseudaminic acid cytidylyltransferase [Bacteroidetes bacterium GWF2_42_66]HAZ03491.1 pseudaminic acid cytidylyltransferase [Marinilabiliales bacterium]HBL78245.1 pseudaminic acid cytidylyltransferase [Prolixibacteraceae bacterium]
MSNLCIIPARGGSKRIPRKNIKPFLEKPIIAYSIEVAIKSGLFDEIMVSTDDLEIADIAEKFGAKIPFLRSDVNANDYATLADVLIEVLTQYNKQGQDFKNICCILPTTPLVSNKKVNEAYSLFLDGTFDSLCPIVAFSYPILRALEFEEDNLRMIWPEYIKTRSQDLKPAYHDSGSFYWVRSKALLDEKTLFCKNGSAIILSENEVQDIDTETDWQLAELKYKLLYE